MESYFKSIFLITCASPVDIKRYYTCLECFGFSVHFIAL